MAVSPEFIEELRARVSLSDIIGKRTKLVRKGQRMSGLCPFHSEKSPSFYVNDAEGFYHCFGCGVNGDAISFLRESDGLEFIEAVRRLADMAGMVVPEETPVDRQKTERRKTLLDVLERTALFYQYSLTSGGGAETREYLAARGLNEDVIKDFRLGYSPKAGLRPTLHQHEIADDLIKTAGLIGVSDKDGSFYDYFRNRVMFPIENRQGQIIAFGARAFGDAKPKYLNSPEGPAFSKKAVLYGWRQARERVRRSLPLMIVEGYMDVIAVSGSGVAAALAPLGTALTEEQIQLVWKLHDEPILCFDGDVAGQKAAARALERLIPLLEPGRSARFAALPEGMDPDDILKQDGPDGLQRILASASGVVDALWIQKSAEYRIDDSRTQPSARAAFWQDMRQVVKTIAHNQTRQAFLDDLDFRINSMRAATKGAFGKGGYGSSNQRAVVNTRRPKTGRIIQYRAILALLISFPECFGECAEQLSLARFSDDALEEVKKAVIDHLIRDPDLDAGGLRHHLVDSGMNGRLEEIFSPDTTARFGMPPERLSAAKARVMLIEAITRNHGRRMVRQKSSRPFQT